MGLIPPEQIDLVRERADIVELIAERLTLTKKGRQFWACCPFHSEKSPSFSVHPDRQIFKCFGCQKGGNIFGFVQEFERVSFPEAVRIVADRVGITIEESNDRRAQRRGSRELLEISEWACSFYERSLWTDGPQAEAARAYVSSRGITEATARAFRLGLARPGWDNLLSAARREGIPPAALVRLGLVIQREGGDRERIYDRFRHRLMFPIADPRGRPVAFGGRRLDDSEDSPKYINSSEVPGLFEKRRILYALDKAKEDRAERLIIVEGYTDVILARQAGIHGVVAVLGTAFGPDHVPLVRRFAERVTVLFDGDVAGQEAARRSLEALVPVDLEVRVAMLTGGQDPADLVRESGAEALEALVNDAPEVFDFVVERSLSDAGASIEQRARAIEQTLALLAPMDPLRLHLHIGRLAQRFQVPEEELRARLRKLRDGARKPMPSRPAERESRPARSEGRRDEPRRPRGGGGEPRGRATGPQRQGAARQAPRAPSERGRSRPASPPSRDAATRFGRGAELKILEALLARPGRAADVFSVLTPRCFSEGPSQRLAMRMQVAADLGQAVSEASLYNELQGEDLALLEYLSGKIHDGHERSKDYDRELDPAACQRILATLRRQQRQEVRRLLDEATRDGRGEDAAALEAELDALLRERQATR